MHNRKAYQLEPRPSTGGQADVFFGVRLSDKLPIALKQRRGVDLEARARMKREIEVQRNLPHDNIMPILDWDDADYEWYVMPRGTRTLADLAVPMDDQNVRTVVEALLAALAVAHAAGNPHRDIKPQNVIEIVAFDRPRWVLADWGLTRRPHGETTNHLTVTGQFLGTSGYAAPESYRDGHAVGARADLYSLGQVIGWATTGLAPLPNVPANAPEPWRRLARSLTRLRAEERPASAAEARAMLEESQQAHDTTAVLEALERAAGDPKEALSACLLAVAHIADHDMMLDRVARVTGVADQLVAMHPDETRDLVEGMIVAFESFGRRNFDHANVPLRWMHEVLRASAGRNLELFEVLVEKVFPLEAAWNRFPQRDRTAAWLNQLRGEPASVVAGYLRSSPEMRKYLGGRVDNAVSPAIAAAMK